MKLLFLLLFLAGCAEITTSKIRCDSFVAEEKNQCLESYENFIRHIDYREFRGGGFNFR